MAGRHPAQLAARGSRPTRHPHVQYIAGYTISMGGRQGSSAAVGGLARPTLHVCLFTAHGPGAGLPAAYACPHRHRTCRGHPRSARRPVWRGRFPPLPPRRTGGGAYGPGAAGRSGRIRGGCDPQTRRALRVPGWGDEWPFP